MAFSFENLNKGSKFDIDTSGFGYTTLADLYNACGKDKVYPLTCIYINTKSKFGAAPVFATNMELVNIPRHMLDTAYAIIGNSEAVEAINNHKVGFTIYQYTQSTYNRVCYGVRFVDVDWSNSEQ